MSSCQIQAKYHDRSESTFSSAHFMRKNPQQDHMPHTSHENDQSGMKPKFHTCTACSGGDGVSEESIRGGRSTERSGRRKKGELKRTWEASLLCEKGVASRRAPSNASALWGPCRNVTVEENLRTEPEVSGGGTGKRSVFSMVKTFVGESKERDRFRFDKACRSSLSSVVHDEVFIFRKDEREV